MKIRSLFAFVLVSLSFVLPALSAEYFVDAQNGNDENDGSEQSPVKSLAKVCDLINAQNPKEALTTVTVLPGNYGEDEGTDVTCSFEGTDKNGTGTHLYRVVLTDPSASRKVLFKARDGKEVTHIVGKKGHDNGGQVVWAGRAGRRRRAWQQ